jgi:hypothetical protein
MLSLSWTSRSSSTYARRKFTAMSTMKNLRSGRAREYSQLQGVRCGYLQLQGVRCGLETAEVN